MGRYIFVGILVLLAAVSFETAYKFLSTPLVASVPVGFRNPIYLTGWTKQFSGAAALVFGVIWLRLILSALKTPKEEKPSQETPLHGSS